MKTLFTLFFSVASLFALSQEVFYRESIIDSTQSTELNYLKKFRNNSDSLVKFIKIHESEFMQNPSPSQLFLLNTYNKWLIESGNINKVSDFEKLRFLYSQNNDTNNVEFGFSFYHESKKLYYQHKFIDAINKALQCEAIIAEQANLNSIETLKCLSLISNLYANVNDNEKSIEYTIKYQRIAQEVKQWDMLATSYNTLGHITKYYDSKLSKQNFKQCIRIIDSKRLSILNIKANSLLVLAEITMQERNNVEALQYLITCNKIIDSGLVLPPATCISFYFTIADVYSALNESDKAEYFYNKSDSVCLASFEPGGFYSQYIKIKRGFNLIRQLKYKESIDLMQEGVNFFSQDASGQFTPLINGINMKIATCMLNINDIQGYQNIIDTMINSTIGFNHRERQLLKEEVDLLNANEINKIWEYYHLKSAEINHPIGFQYKTEDVLQLLETVSYIFNRRFVENIDKGSLNFISGMYMDLMSSYLDWFTNKELTQKQLQRLWFSVSLGKSYQLVFQVNQRNTEDSIIKKIKLFENEINANKNNLNLVDSLLSLKVDLANQAFKNKILPKVETYSFIAFDLATENFSKRLLDWPQNHQIVDLYSHDSTLYSFTVANGEIDFTYYKTDNSIINIVSKAKKQIKLGNTYETGFLPEFENLFAHCDTSIENITIIPHEYSYTVPFELINFKSKTLINRFNISYTYSPFIWFNNKLIVNKTESILAVAPVFSNSKQPYSTNTFREINLLSEDLELDITLNDMEICSIPETLNECISICEEFKKKKHKATLLSKKLANEDNFKKYCGSASIIHIATHGISSNSDPSESRLLLNPSQNERNSKSDGFLFLDEIFDLNLTADLVVLSACKTGTGKIVSGEGIMALPRGFIYAGVPNVIASLWKVHDEKTKDLMVAFYKHLLEDKVNYAAALRLAKLDCIEKGYLPIDWAGFVLIGN